MIKNQSRIAAGVLEKIGVPFREIVDVVDFVTIDHVDVARQLVRVFRPGVAETPRGGLVDDIAVIGYFAGTKRQVIIGEAGRLADIIPIASALQGLVGDIGGNKERVAEEKW